MYHISIKILLSRALNYIYHKTGCKLFRVLSNKIIYRAVYQVNGLHFVLTSPSDLLETSQDYEKEVTEHVMRSIEENGIFIDVGAHIGVHSFRIARTFPKVKIISIEPDPMAFEALTLGIKLNNLHNIFALNIALSDIDGEIPLYVKLNTATSSIIESQSAFKYIKVKALRLDSLIKTLKISRVDVIKIDVEGAELKVLRGAINTLKSFKPKVIAEVRKRNLQEFLSIVSTLGYTCKIIKEEIDNMLLCTSST